MADIDNPKTHVEDQDVKLPRKQPESPRHEGIDPLTESDTMYPRENTKDASEKLDKKTNAKRSDEDLAAEEKTAQSVKDQKETEAKANTPDSQLPDEDKTATPGKGDQADTEGTDKQDTSPAKDNAGQDLPQTAKPANTNPAGERGKEVSSDASKQTTK